MRKQFHSGSCGKFTLIYIAKSNRKKDGMLTILRTDSTSSLLARGGGGGGGGVGKSYIVSSRDTLY